VLRPAARGSWGLSAKYLVEAHESCAGSQRDTGSSVASAIGPRRWAGAGCDRGSLGRDNCVPGSRPDRARINSSVRPLHFLPDSWARSARGRWNLRPSCAMKAPLLALARAAVRRALPRRRGALTLRSRTCGSLDVAVRDEVVDTLPSLPERGGSSRPPVSGSLSLLWERTGGRGVAEHAWASSAEKMLSRLAARAESIRTRRCGLCAWRCRRHHAGERARVRQRARPRPSFVTEAL